MRVNFGRVMERMRELRAKMSANDSAKRFASMGVDVYQVALYGKCMDCVYASLARLGSDLLSHGSISDMLIVCVLPCCATTPCTSVADAQHIHHLIVLVVQKTLLVHAGMLLHC